VHGGKPAQGKKGECARNALRSRCRSRRCAATLSQPWNILITGVGGTGVVTIGALLGMAGHLEGKGATVLDQTGLAQKGGAVTTHIRIARSPADIHAVRIAAGEADLVLGCDMVVVNDYWALSKIRAERTRGAEHLRGDARAFTTQPGHAVPGRRHRQGGKAPRSMAKIRCWSMRRNWPPRCWAMPSPPTCSCSAMPGSRPGAALVRFADARDRAQRRRGGDEQEAFAWGRLAVVDLGAVIEAAGVQAMRRPPRSAPRCRCRCWARPTTTPASRAPSRRPARRRTAPRPGTRAAMSPSCRWTTRACRVRWTSSRVASPSSPTTRTPPTRSATTISWRRCARWKRRRRRAAPTLSEAVARYFFKLMAYKDEYEVARLYTSGAFKRRLRAAVRGRLHAALPPRPAAAREEERRGPAGTKREYGSWVFRPRSGVLAKLQAACAAPRSTCSATPPNASRRTRADRRLREDRHAELLDKLDAGNVRPRRRHRLACPEHIRGYGHVKEAHLARALKLQDDLMVQWRNGIPVALVA
jgi:indolepyruvate ferredoxin oxidoreductase